MRSEWEIFESLFFYLETDQILRLCVAGIMSADSDLYARAQKCWWNVSISINSTDVLISNRNLGPEENFSLSLKSKFLTRVGQGPPPKKKSSFLRNHGIVHPSNFPHQWALIFDGARWRPTKVVRRARIFSLRCRHMVAPFEWKTAFHTDRLFARQSCSSWISSTASHIISSSTRPRI